MRQDGMRLLITAALVQALTVLAAAGAVASHYDSLYPTDNSDWLCSDGSVGDVNFCLSDNSTLTNCKESSLTTSDKNAINSTINGSYDNTDLSVSHHASCTYSGGSETDIVYQKGSGVPSGNVVWTWCNDAVSFRTCDQHYVRYIPSFSVNRALACHETGHSIGLTHGQGASPRVANDSESLECMKRPTPSADYFLGTHNINQINLYY